MRLTILAIAALAAYEYDKKQVQAGKSSIFSSLRDFAQNLAKKEAKSADYSSPSNTNNYGTQARTGTGE